MSFCLNILQLVNDVNLVIYKRKFLRHRLLSSVSREATKDLIILLFKVLPLISLVNLVIYKSHSLLNPRRRGPFV